MDDRSRESRACARPVRLIASVSWAENLLCRICITRSHHKACEMLTIHFQCIARLQHSSQDYEGPSCRNHKADDHLTSCSALTICSQSNVNLYTGSCLVEFSIYYSSTSADNQTKSSSLTRKCPRLSERFKIVDLSGESYLLDIWQHLRQDCWRGHTS